MNKYKITPIDVIEALVYTQSKDYDGLYYPADEYFVLEMTHEDMLIMVLSLSGVKVEKL